MADSIKIGNLDISSFKVGSSDCKVYLGDTLLYPSTPPAPTLQWVTFNNGDTIPSDLDIYGISGVTNDFANTWISDWSNPMVFTPSRNRVDIVFKCSGDLNPCYSDSPLNTDVVSYIFSDVGCCDYVNQGATVSGTIQLYIYA